MPITPYLPADKVFEREVIEAMRRAFVEALALAGIRGQGSAAIQRIIANRIVHAGLEGESDPRKLCDLALASLGLKR